MDVFLAKLYLTLGHIATAMLPLVMNNLSQKYIHSGLTFVIKYPLNLTEKYIFCFLCTFLRLYQKTEILNYDTAPYNP